MARRSRSRWTSNCRLPRTRSIILKKYAKAKTAVKEKQIQLSENDNEINYLESVLAFLETLRDVKEIEALRTELVETGYLRRRKQAGGFREKNTNRSHTNTR